MNDTVIAAARTLLSKNIAFSIYRFPAEDFFQLALADEINGKGEIVFWMAPFIPDSQATEIFLREVDRNDLGETFLQLLHSLPTQPPIDLPLPEETSREAYFERIDAFLTDIRAGKLQKAILSRVIHQNKPAGFDAVNSFLQIAEEFSNAFVHLSQHPVSGIWMGASPELLIKKRGQHIHTMALAGTRPRNNEGNYKWRLKELEEHQMVWDHIERTLQSNGCTMVSRRGPETVEAGQVVHLRTDYVFHQERDGSLRDVLTGLHPTPAIGGLPADKGVECILVHEGYNRRYYCGFVGHTDFDQTADLYINLRCMQIGKDRIAIYVGGGITAASDPQEEWEETIFKSSTMVEKINPVQELHPDETVG